MVWVPDGEKFWRYVYSNKTMMKMCVLLPYKHVKYSKYSKEYLKKNTNYFYAIKISISLAILSKIFIQIGYFF